MLKAQVGKYGDTYPESVIKDRFLHFPTHMWRLLLDELPEASIQQFGQPSRTVKLWREVGDRVFVPRNTPIKDVFGKPEEFHCLPNMESVQTLKAHITLRAHQQRVISEIVATGYDHIVRSPCGSGKTVIGIALACLLGFKTLVVCPTNQLVDQWVDRIKTFVENPSVSVNDDDSGDFHVVTVQSVKKYDKQAYGLMILDEAHTIMAESWGEDIQEFYASYRVALSATPVRGDGLDHRIDLTFGNYHEVTEEELVKAGLYAKPVIYAVTYGKNNIRLKFAGKDENGRVIQAYCPSKTRTALGKDPKRQALAHSIAMRKIKAGRNVVVVSDRKDTVLDMALLMSFDGEDVGVIVSGSPASEMDKDHLVAIDKLGKQGLDKPELSTMVSMFSTRKPQAIEQLVGRLSRPKEMKPELYDIWDTDLPAKAFKNPETLAFYVQQRGKPLNPLEEACIHRLRQYAKMGLEVWAIDGKGSTKLVEEV